MAKYKFLGTHSHLEVDGKAYEFNSAIPVVELDEKVAEKALEHGIPIEPESGKPDQVDE